MKQAHTPETVAAGNGIGIAVLLELLAVDILAGQKVAVRTIRILMTKHLLTKGAIHRIVPQGQNISTVQITEHLFIDEFFPAGKMTLE